jgi:hypothetical protein
MDLHRYWIEFDFAGYPRRPLGLGLGCGVTASDPQTALGLVRERVFEGADLPKLSRVDEDIDVSRLDAAHVRSNMGNPAVRGIWFPLGYAE